MDGESRIVRLVGDGVDEMSGGGISLSDASSAILQHLLDMGKPVPQGTLVKMVIDKLHRSDEQRVLAIWGDWDALTDDLITQLGVKGLVRVTSLFNEQKEFFAELGDAFEVEKPLEFISKAEVDKARGNGSGHAEHVIVFDKVARKQRDQIAELLLEVKRFRTKIRAKQRGKAGVIADASLSTLISKLESGVATELPSLAVVYDLPVNGDLGEPGGIYEGELPNVLVLCPGCNIKKAKTKDNFVVYASRKADYWRVQCRSCGINTSAKEYQAELLRAIAELTVDSTLPRVSEVYERAVNGNDYPRLAASSTRSILQSWTRMAKNNQLPFPD